MKKLLLLASLMALASTSAFAVSTCVGNVTQYTGATTCMVDGIEVGNFSVQPLAGKSVTISFGAGTAVVGNSLILDFRLAGFNPPSAPGDDIVLAYQVIGGSGVQFTGIDLRLPATAIGVAILEAACTVECDTIVNNSQILAQIAAVSPGYYAAGFTTPVSSFWVEKDIQFNGVNGIAVISDFQNSHETNVPEPTTGLLLGTALLGLAALRRRQSAKK